MFEGQYFSGKVVEFDKETSWYKIVYEDCDSEELDFQELQGILLPIESEIPQKQIAFHVYQSSKSSPKFCRKESMSSPTSRKSSKKGPPLLSLEQHLHIHPLVKRKGKRSSERRNPCWGKVHEKDPNTSIEACFVSSFQTQKRSQDAAIKLSTETPFTLFDKTKGVPTRVTSKNRKRKRNGSKKSSISTKSLQKDPMITTESDKRLPEKISSEKNPQEVPLEVYNELEAAPVPENQISIDQNPQLCNQVTECNTCHQQGGDTCVKASIISGENIGLSNNSFADCGRRDPEVTEDAEKNFTDLLSEELKLREAEALENQQQADIQLLEAKKMASQYQKEADKCNSGMETCEAAREKAEAALHLHKRN